MIVYEKPHPYNHETVLKLATPQGQAFFGQHTLSNGIKPHVFLRFPNGVYLWVGSRTARDGGDTNIIERLWRDP